ncbi:MAG: protease pro-enzyme activation domain-containing protein, partial [Pseudoxanthomonas sp.]
MLTALALSGAPSCPAEASGSLPTVARATVLRSTDVEIGTLSRLQPMHVVIALKLRNEHQLDSLIAAHQTLTSTQFALRHAPTPEQARRVANYLTTMGYHNVVIASNRLLVTAEGTSVNAQMAFETSFARVVTREGRIAFANKSDAHIPLYLKDSVLSVMGLQSVHQVHTFARAQPAGVSTAAITGHNPNEFSPIYGGTGVATAAGITVGIMT